MRDAKRCHYHPDRDAAQQCKGCQKPLCAQCIGDQPPEAPLCPTCQAILAAGEMSLSAAERREEVARTAARRKRNNLLKTVFAWSLVAVCLCIVLVRLPVLAKLLQPDVPIRNGSYATDAQTDACIRNLWRQAALLRQGKPADLSLVCPASGKTYRIEANGGNMTVECPEPGRHGLSQLRVEKNRPMPAVKR